MKPVQVLYVSAAPSPRVFLQMKGQLKDGVQEVTYGMAESGFKFHNLIQKGLAESGAQVTSLVGRYATPEFYEGGFWRRSREVLPSGVRVDHLSFPNVRGLKQLWLATQFLLHAIIWRSRTAGAEHRIMVADAAYVSALPAALVACAGKRIAKVAIFADLYTYMADVTDASRGQSRAHRVIARAVRSLYSKLDGFILLTEQMNSVVNPNGRPHLIMEGLTDPTSVSVGVEQPSTGHDVLYAGALRKAYGIDSLLMGFSAWKQADARLIIYGAGDYADDVRAAALVDNRIEYRGTASLEEVFRAEQHAWLLVNPRPADQEFTKYSFPSKTIEYMSSGTPVLMTPLPGMPTEYRQFVRLIDQPGPDGVTGGLERAAQEPPHELAALGSRARDFVVENKSSTAQGRRILEFAQDLL